MNVFEKVGDHLVTVAKRGVKNAKENAPALAKNPFIALTETDSAWFQHSVSELKRGVEFHVEMRQEMAAREEAANKAGAAAVEEYSELGDGKPTYNELHKRFIAGLARVKLEAQACRMLAEYVNAFGNLDFMRKTQTGQNAYFGVAALMKELSEQAYAALAEYENGRDKLLVSNRELPAPAEHYVNCKVFEARYSPEREAWVVGKVGAAAKVCANAIEFETVKAYVVSLEGTSEDPDWLLNKVKGHVKTASGGVSTAGGLTPGQPGTILAAVGAFVDAGSNVVDKMATSAIRERRVEKIIKSPDGEQMVVKAMNKDSTIMAQYLRKKFLANLRLGLSQVKPIITGASLGLDAASFGVPAGSIVTLVWDTVVDSIVEAAGRAQQERIDRAAKKKFEGLKKQTDIPKETTPIWKEACNTVADLLPDTLDEVLNEGTNVAAMGAKWESLALPGRQIVIKALGAKLKTLVLAKMEFPPADLWSGDDFVRNLTRLSTFEEDMRRMGLGVQQVSLTT